MNDMNDGPMVDRPRRDSKKWKKQRTDGFANKAKKNWKHREAELEEEDLEQDLKEYK